MDRNREARRASIVGSNGFNRRRHRTNSLRDSPDDDGGLELQESVRLRDRVKKDRERERDRERGRERDFRERSSRSKRRRDERLASNREDIVGDETSEESVNDDEDEEDEENASTTAAAGVRLGTPEVGSIPNHHHHHGSLTNHHNSHSSTFSHQQVQNTNTTSNIVSSNHHLQHRKSYPPPGSSSSKVIRAPPVWKSGDEMISVSVPRKARTASTKRSHDWISSSSNNNSGGGVSVGDQALRPESSSPARQSIVPTSTPLPAAPMSPSSSNPSMRKKLKPSMNSGGLKLKPPKVSSKPSSSNPEELEIEIAEVLYGLMTQSQGPSSKKEDSREANRSNSDPKSRNSSPISNSASVNNPHSGPNSTPLSVVAPKRKRPRLVPENPCYVGRCGLVSSKPEPDPPSKIEVSSPILEKLGGSAVDNGYAGGGNSVHLQGLLSEQTGLTAAESTKMDSDYKSVAEELKDRRDFSAKVELSSPKEKESLSTREDDSIKKDAESTATASALKESSLASEKENQKEAKFEIDLMAPPPHSRSSSERESHVETVAAAVTQNLVLSTDSGLKAAMVSKDKDNERSGRDLLANVVAEEEKVKLAAEDSESHRLLIENKGRRSINLQLDLEKPDKEISVGVHAVRNKSQQPSQKPPQQQMHVKASREEPLGEKSGPSASSLPLPLPMSMASWPGGLPRPMGYMAPLQGVVSMDGSTVAPTHLQPLFSQPRPKRCATHCHIARNIHFLQQFMKMSPFWLGASNATSLFGSKTCNLNALPAADLHGNTSLRSVNNAVEKGQSLPTMTNHGGKEKASQAAVSASADSAPRKQQQILIQQALPPVAAGNLLGPAFIFPMSQQVAGVGGTRPGVPKSSTLGASANTSISSASSVSSATAATMSFNYPNMGTNESQYLAILPNNAYPFPMPTVGAPPSYRGPPPQAMPLFNGSFYSPQMIHPSQLQHSQPPPTQVAQIMQAQQNATASNGSSSSQKHMQSQQPRAQNVGAGSSSGSGSLQNFAKIQSTQQLQQSHNQYTNPSRARHHDGEMGGEDSLSSNDGRGARASVNIYGQNLGFPIHPQNFSLMTSPPALASAGCAGTNNNQNEKKAHQSQQQALKTSMESLPHHGFAVSFGGINGTNAIDVATMAQNHAMFQSSSEATRQNIQMMAAAAVAAQVAQKKNNNFRISEDVKSGGVDSVTADDERKISGGKGLGAGQSIAFSRSDLVDGPATQVQGNNVIESSPRSVSVSGATRSSQPPTSNSMGSINIQNAHIQAQFQHQQQQQQQQQQQMLQLKQQQEHQRLSATSVRNKVPVTTNGSIYLEHFNSPPVANKFPSLLSGFPQNLVQSNTSSPTHSPQWKSSVRTTTSQAPSLTSATATTVKNLTPQHSRASQPPVHTQISFGGNHKASSNSQGQPPSGNNQAPSSPMMVGSPTTSSISKGASGSPRMTTSASANNKMGQPSLSAQQPKNSPSITSQKAASVLGNPHVSSSSTSSVAKAQMQHQQSQQQLPKAMQQAQLFFSNPYTQSQPHSAITSSATASGLGGYYIQRRRPDQHHQEPNAPATTPTGMLSLSPPVTLSGTNTSDPAKAIAAGTGNMKGTGLPSHGLMNASQFAAHSAGTVLPAGFSYLHPVPAAVQVKPGEHKHSAGNDNLNAWQPEKK